MTKRNNNDNELRKLLHCLLHSIIGAITNWNRNNMELRILRVMSIIFLILLFIKLLILELKSL
jgi:hypothetical protein